MEGDADRDRLAVRMRGVQHVERPQHAPCGAERASCPVLAFEVCQDPVAEVAVEQIGAPSAAASTPNATRAVAVLKAAAAGLRRRAPLRAT